MVLLDCIGSDSGLLDRVSFSDELTLHFSCVVKWQCWTNIQFLSMSRIALHWICGVRFFPWVDECKPPRYVWVICCPTVGTSSFKRFLSMRRCSSKMRSYGERVSAHNFSRLTGWSVRTISLLPLSPDMSPLNVFLCAYVKDETLGMHIDNVDDLYAWVSNAVSSAKPQILENMWHAVEYHADIVQVTDGTCIGTRWKFLSCSFELSKPFGTMSCTLCFRNVCNMVKILWSTCVLFNLFWKSVNVYYKCNSLNFCYNYIKTVVAFLLQPLRLSNVDENVAREIDDVLLKDSEKEEFLRRVSTSVI